LDVILPKKNGFQVCRQLKKTPETSGIKILMLTHKDQESDRFWGKKQGADEYMTKPFDAEAFLNGVAALL
jgi:twitching motility two-component system response regulator PilH